MRNWKLYRRILIIVLIFNLITIAGLAVYHIEKNLPDEIKILVGTEESFNFKMPIEANIAAEDTAVLSVNGAEDLKVPSNQIKIDMKRPFTIESSETGKFTMDLKLFGIFKFKKISLDVIESVELIPCGTPIGIYVETNGILVLGNGRITGEDGLNYEPISNKLKSGDYIIAINDTEVRNKNDLIKEIQKTEGKDIHLLIRRNNEKITVRITPVRTAGGQYKIGAWIRDNTQGIGTLTYISNNGHFGALGHGITDIDTGLLMEIREGSIYVAEIMSIVKGKEGEPGELIGMIRQQDKYRIGEITDNTYQGIFGRTNGQYKVLKEAKPLEIGLKQEIKKGKAYVRCMVEGELDDYEIQIENVDVGNSNHSKGIVIRITDSRLLNTTGGIVQGMSGSPIIQNNKIIGAVTHVFMQDSAKGYGTFIENMVNNLE